MAWQWLIVNTCTNWGLIKESSFFDFLVLQNKPVCDTRKFLHEAEHLCILSWNNFTHSRPETAALELRTCRFPEVHFLHSRNCFCALFPSLCLRGGVQYVCGSSENLTALCALCRLYFNQRGQSGYRISTLCVVRYASGWDLLALWMRSSRVGGWDVAVNVDEILPSG